MDVEKDDFEYGDDSSQTETDELLFRPATEASRLSPVLKIAAAIVIGVVVFAITLFSLDSQLRKTIIPPSQPAKTCTNPTIRREWRTLNDTEKLDYVEAVQCLGRSPSKLGLNGTTRYEDFVWFHLQVYLNSHKVAPSLPWHRYYIHIFEKALKDECGLKGHLPYWDWALDAALPEESPIWDTELGMGGNGVGSGHCVEDGPFSFFRPEYPVPHCLQRHFYPEMHGINYTVVKVDSIVNQAESYDQFRVWLEMGPHRMVHNGIGGEMPTDHSSNDPIFWVHHAQIDRMWWRWQMKEPVNRTTIAYEGPTVVDERGWPSDVWNASISDIFPMYDMAPDVSVGELLDTEGEILCYRYPDYYG